MTSFGPSTTARAHDPFDWPSIPFGAQDTALGQQAIALTFDDGPGSPEADNPTAAILDVLQAYGLKATFFLCGDTATHAASDEKARALVRRMRDEGHAIGNHSWTHANMAMLTDDEVAAEFAHNEAFLRAAAGARISLALYRMPYGVPFYGVDEQAGRVAPLTAPYGVHVGWGIDSGDWKCIAEGRGADCIVEVVKRELALGHSGPLLMHSLFRPSAEALPVLLELFRCSNIRVVSVEDLVQARYGVGSEALRQMAASNASVPDVIGDAARRQSENHLPWPVNY